MYTHDEEWSGTKGAKGSRYNVIFKEAYTWQQRYQQLQANLRLICTVEIIGEGSVQAAMISCREITRLIVETTRPNRNWRR